MWIINPRPPTVDTREESPEQSVEGLRCYAGDAFDIPPGHDLQVIGVNRMLGGCPGRGAFLRWAGRPPSRRR